MKIFIYTSNFLGTKQIIELCEYTFKYGSQHYKNVPILVGQSDPEFYKKLPRDEPFIFIFAGISQSEVKNGFDIILKHYIKNKRMNIFVITKIKNYNAEFLYKDLNFKGDLKIGFQEPFKGFEESHFFISGSIGFEENFSKSLRDVIGQYEI